MVRGLSGERTLTNPISAAFSLKHCLQMLRPYLRIKPALWVQTRLWSVLEVKFLNPDHWWSLTKSQNAIDSPHTIRGIPFRRYGVWTSKLIRETYCLILARTVVGGVGVLGVCENRCCRRVRNVQIDWKGLLNSKRSFAQMMFLVWGLMSKALSEDNGISKFRTDIPPTLCSLADKTDKQPCTDPITNYRGE